MNLYYFNEENDYIYKEKRKLKSVIKKIENSERKKFKEINIIFCSDEYLRKINLKYLKRNYYTDIITFPYQEKEISGDIFISIERVKENGQYFNKSFINELRRVLIHGILHLCGYKDYKEKEKKLMKEKEELYLKIFKLTK